MHWSRRLKASLAVSRRGGQGHIRFKEHLSTHTTLHIGGPADVWVEPDNFEELRRIICRCAKEKIPYFVIGRGSNILATDAGFKGVVICLNSSVFKKIKVKGSRISCGAGLPLNKLIRETQKRGLAGLEFLAGIPASTAGALVMNAGNQKHRIGKFVKSVTVMDRQAKKKLLKLKQLRFGYRQSNLNRYIVLEVVLELLKRSPQEVKENITANLSKKRKTQDLISRSAGCIFRNPRHRLTAAEMIEACGLKRLRRGGAEISGKHANFIINRHGAKAGDILYLIDLAQREVKKKFGVQLKPEIKIIK